MSKISKAEIKQKIKKCLNGAKQGYSADKIVSVLRIKRGDRVRFLLTLGQMERAGDVVLNKKGQYMLPSNTSFRARIISLSRGFGFAKPESGGADCFIPGRDLNEALPGDTVMIQMETGDPRGPHGRVIEILEKGGHLFSGRFSANENSREVLPDSLIRYPLPVRRDKTSEYKDGDKVRFTVSFNKEGELTARILTSYGSADSAKVCADAIIDTAGIPSVFPDEVREQAETLRSQGIREEDLKGRTDLRDWTILTIDGQDAKDLDDAVSLEQVENGWRLGVHIADVSHYVRENTPLDREARRRGTSVYFADRVIPMLPEALSNGACSLNAGEDKLTLSAIITLSSNGNFIEAAIKKTIIRSRVRGVYREINDLFNDKAEDSVKEKYAPVRDMLTNMRRLAVKLKEAASRRGTMDLISTESAFVLDHEGHPVDIYSRETGESEGMIEQFMISANVAVASFARQHGIPFVYRIHEQPDPMKLKVLSEMAQRLGLKNTRLDKQLDLRALMEEAKETTYARLISDRLLRSMAKAKYSERPLGHYGLALKDYCHFTSPIRRYPDLSIHRILSDVLGGVSKEQIVQHYTAFAQESSELSSQYEIRAMMAERDCEDCYKAEFISRFIGEEFDGVISSISGFGVYVELPNSVEGMIRLENLPEENLRYDDVASLINSRGKPVYTIGDNMTIRVEKTDVSSGRIDFSPVIKE